MEKGDEPVTKTAKQLEKESKKLAKLEKFKQKQAKVETKKEVNTEKVDSKKKAVKKDRTDEPILYTVITAPGEKKDISGALPDSYSPRYVEAAWYAWWEKQGFFKPEYGRESFSIPNPKGTFVMIIPPPNVTGSLHLGHALTNAVEDTLTRWNRMKGKTTLWNPGCDHAGIATQVVVEKKLWRECKKTRYDIGREEFIKKIWEWKNEKGDRIYTQLRQLGSSLDWDRTCFTMDSKLCKAVVEAFIRLHEDGDIYRTNRLVNWSCFLKSAISDIEVDKLELSGRTFLNIPGYSDKVEFGVLVHFAYEIINDKDELTGERVIVATTRIETMLGDTAIAVHPDDDRYKHLHGKYVKHPFSNRKLPIICDVFVDKEFGTGIVKITPAHDHNDYEVGKRHNLQFITIFSDDGVIIGDCGEFTGMKRFDARKAVLQALKKIGLYEKTAENAMVVPLCSRTKDVVEPLIKSQWYVKCGVMAEKASEAVRSGELKIYPEHHVKTWFYWLNNIRDWCISRQLWWGHRIPAYYATIKGLNDNNEVEDEKYWISGRTEKEALQKACKVFQVSEDSITLERDPDVLDTWFSSALFPFSIFGWPDETEELKVFYPGTLLETGHDILFFWVARMVFFGQRLLNQLPFREVFLHPIVRDAHGRKMSKSLGNVIDPMDVIYGVSLEALHKQLHDSNLDPKEIEKAKAGQKQDYPNGIPECGTDALRFALCAYLSQGRDINLDILRIQGYRFFCNKLWNAIKFSLMYFPSNFAPKPITEVQIKMPMNLWILSRLSQAVDICEKGFTSYDLNSVTTACYNLWLYEICDVYLESLKPVFSSDSEENKEECRQTLLYVIDSALRLLSPFMPYITEELYQRLPHLVEYPSICVAAYPESEDYNKWKNEKLDSEIQFIQKIIHCIRSAQSDYNIPKSQKTEAYLCSTDQQTMLIVRRYLTEIKTLAYCSKVEACGEPPLGCAILTVNDKCQVHLSLKNVINIEKELDRLNKKMELVKQNIIKLEKAMCIENYETKVPVDIQKTNTEKSVQLTAELDSLNAAVQTLNLLR